MKLIHTFVFLTFVLYSLVSAQDFREVNWGATMSDVQASEEFTPVATEVENALSFTGKVNGKKVAAVYEFLPDDRLYSAGYVFEEDHTNRNRYIRDYEEISAVLERVYGTPKTTNTIWSNDLYRDSPQDYGMAVAVGHVQYQASWDTETTLIGHVLHGNDFQILHGVIYSSIELADEAQQHEQEVEDDAF